jgi:hypothetical protein
MSAEVDEAILTCARKQWMKVARLLVEVSERLAAAEDNPRFDEIAVRVQALVATGALESVGNLERWRFSEVRLPARPPTQLPPASSA